MVTVINGKVCEKCCHSWIVKVNPPSEQIKKGMTYENALCIIMITLSSSSWTEILFIEYLSNLWTAFYSNDNMSHAKYKLHR